MLAGCWGSVRSVLGGLYPSIVCIVLGPWNPNTSPSGTFAFPLPCCPPLLLGRACERAERGRCPGGRAALVPAASLAPRTPSCSSAPGMRKQTVILPIIDSLHDGPTNGGSAAQPPSTPRTPRRASPRKQSKSQEIPPHTMPQIGAQTMQALSSVKDPAVHAVIESEALHQMSQSFTKGSEWQSTAVHTEVLLQHVLEASGCPIDFAPSRCARCCTHKSARLADTSQFYASCRPTSTRRFLRA